MDSTQLLIPQDLFIELVKKFKARKKENGEPLYTDKDISNIIFKIDSLIREGKIKITKKK